MNLQELQRKHHELIATADSVLEAAKAKGAELSPDEARVVDHSLAEAKKLGQEIQSIKDKNTILRFDPMALVSGGSLIPLPGESDPTNPILMPTMHPREAAVRRDFEAWITHAIRSRAGVDIPTIEASNPSGAISVGTGTNLDSVGFAIPTMVLPFLKSYLAYSPFEKVGSSIISVAHMRTINLPVVSAGAPPSAYPEGQGPAAGATGSQPFGLCGFQMGANKKTRQVTADWEALQSTEVPLQPVIVDELLVAMANALTSDATQALYNALTSPPNYTIPTGGLPPCQVGGSSVQADVFGQMNALRHSLVEGLEGPECAWMLSRNTLATIRNTRASTSGVPMFLYDADKDLILGRPYVTNEYFDSICGAGFIAYGNWNKGAWLRRSPLLTRILDQIAWLNSQICFVITSWADNHFLAELVGSAQPPTHQSIYFTVLPSGSLP